MIALLPKAARLVTVLYVTRWPWALPATLLVLSGCAHETIQVCPQKVYPSFDGEAAWLQQEDYGYQATSWRELPPDYGVAAGVPLQVESEYPLQSYPLMFPAEPQRSGPQQVVPPSSANGGRSAPPSNLESPRPETKSAPPETGDNRLPTPSPSAPAVPTPDTKSSRMPFTWPKLFGSRKDQPATVLTPQTATLPAATLPSATLPSATLPSATLPAASAVPQSMSQQRRAPASHRTPISSTSPDTPSWLAPPPSGMWNPLPGGG